MNIIFLDVDGVLNSTKNAIELYQKTHISRSGNKYPFDENCLKNLQQLVFKTDSKIVITSTWRKKEEDKKILLSKLKEYNLGKLVIGYTPILASRKVYEIKAFLSSLNFNPNFIILDDNSNFEDLSPYLIKTNSYLGLTTENIDEASKKLLKEIP